MRKSGMSANLGSLVAPFFLVVVTANVSTGKGSKSAT